VCFLLQFFFGIGLCWKSGAAILTGRLADRGCGD